MKKTLLILTIFLFAGCSVNRNEPVIITQTNLETTEISTYTMPEQTTKAEETTTTTQESLSALKSRNISVKEYAKNGDTFMLGKETDTDIIKRYINGEYDDSQQNKSMEEILSTLLDKNVVCFYLLYKFDLFEAEKVDDTQYSIISNHKLFDNASELEDFVGSTYIDNFKNKWFPKGDAKNKAYYDLDNKFYWNQKVAPLFYVFYPFKNGYYFEINDLNEEECKFTLYFTELVFEEDGDYYAKKSSKKAVAVVEDGRWKLTGTIFADNYDEEFK